MIQAAGKFAWQRAIMRCRELSPSTKLLAHTLSVYARRDGGNCHPGEKRLANDCGTTERRIRERLAELRDRGWIYRTSVKSARRGLADTYRLTIPQDFTGSDEPVNNDEDDDDYRPDWTGKDEADEPSEEDFTGPSGTDYRPGWTGLPAHLVTITGPDEPDNKEGINHSYQEQIQHSAASSVGADSVDAMNELSTSHPMPSVAHLFGMPA